jgi:hypothetical protein
MNDNLNELPSLYTVTGDIKDINTLLISREAVRLNAQTAPQQPVNEREAFEAIFLPGSGVTFDRDANGFYKGVFVSEAWKVWQARAALSAPQAAPNDDGTLPTYTDELELRYIEACEERDHLRQVLAAQAAQAAAAQPLTESAIQQIGLDIPSQHHPGWLIEFARAIERAHGITED